MRLMLLGASGLVAFAVAFVMARREFSRSTFLSVRTFRWLFAAFTILTVAILFGANRSAWPLPLPLALSTTTGGIFAALGIALYLAARLRLRSFRATWGLALDQLVTQGPYRFSRNPQTTGAVAVLMGTALLGRSAASLVLVGMYATSCLMWIRVEEQVLERRFGSEYRQYRSNVRRFL